MRVCHLSYLHHTTITYIYTLSLHDALPILPALTVKLSKYNVDDVALGVCKTGAEEAGVTEVRTSFFGTCFTDTKSYIVNVIDRKSGSAGMPRPISYAVFCLKKKKKEEIQ